MKKLMIILSVFAIVSASSCKKAYTCICSSTGSTGGFTIQNLSIPTTTHINAMSTCSQWQSTQQTLMNTSGGSGSVSCSI